MTEPESTQPSDEEMRETLWARIGNRSIEELPKQLGFTPSLKTQGENRRVFEDSGFEVTMWIGKTGKVAMINVRRL
jgi:hypothetical protein